MRTKGMDEKTLERVQNWPMCDCDGPTCCGGRGPAMYSVLRNGKPMNVCSRCDLPGDQDKHELPGLREMPASVFLDFDLLGALCLLLDDIAPATADGRDA